LIDTARVPGSRVGAVVNEPSQVDRAKQGQIVRAMYTARCERFVRMVQFKHVDWQKRRPRWDGGKYRGKKYECIWPEIADFIRSCQLPYFEFIRQKFSMCSRTPPPPDALLSDIGNEQLRDEIDEYRSQYRWQLENQKIAHAAICHGLGVFSRKPGDELMLWDETDQRSHLFVYSLAVAEEKQQEMEMYRLEAITQYLECPTAYDSAWESILPAGMYREAMTAYGVKLPE
jgi:hypothetical protein